MVEEVAPNVLNQVTLSLFVFMSGLKKLHLMYSNSEPRSGDLLVNDATIPNVTSRVAVI
jgi:hypothetical protein